MKTSASTLIFFCLLAIAVHISVYLPKAHAAEWQAQAMIKPGEGETPLLPFLDYYIDQSRSMDIEEVAKASFAQEFKPLALYELPRVEGVTWLRFTLAPLAPEARPGAFLLDMGESFPGVPILFDPERNELSGALEWQEKAPTQRNIMLLPEQGSQSLTCYIKIDGLPGPWFAPMLRTPQNAASNLSSLSRNAAILALGVVMLICLLRGLGEKGQWRIWTCLFTAVALCQALLGMPSISDKFSLNSLAAVLSPGIALMLLPHVGRHLMQTVFNSKSIDLQLFLLSLPGAAIALWPLIPGWSWLDRWVDIWPLFTLLFVPTSLGAWIMGLGGAKRFLSACLIPPIFTAAALGGLDFGFPANVLSSAPIWGIAICALLIAATRSPLLPPEGNKKASRTNGGSLQGTSKADEIINLDHPLDDPNLRLLPSRDNSKEPEIKDPAPKPLAEQSLDNPQRAQSLEDRENSLRVPLDDILRQAAALGQCSLPPAVRQYAESIIGSAHSMADIISGETVSPSLPESLSTPQQKGPFSLQRLLRNVHDSVSSFAESAGTALSWYIPPNMGRLYQGNPAELENTLSLLLESSVRASKNGSVHISARRMPGSEDPGHILFSITDNGAGVPPKERSSLAISRAWELIGRQGGYLAMEAGPDGVDIALSLRFTLEGEEEQKVEGGNHILLASDNASKRREIAKALEDLPCRISQLGSAQEMLVCQSMDPAALLITHGQLARPAAADTIRKFADLAKQAGFTKSFILAITEDDKEWRLLKLSGFTHAMQEPDNMEAIKDTISALLHALEEIKEKDSTAENQEETLENVPLLDENELSLKPSIDKLQNSAGKKTLKPDLQAQATAHPDKGLIISPSLLDENGENTFEGPDWLTAQEDEKQTKKEAGPKLPDLSGASNGTELADSGDHNSYTSIIEYVAGENSANEMNPEPKSKAQKDRPFTPENESGDPVVNSLIRELDAAMQSASQAFERRDSVAVAQATGRIIRESETVGLRLLARMASCVERAAQENDMNALSDLLPELALAVERNRLALNQNRGSKIT